MGKLVTPKVYLIGYTEVNYPSVVNYLRDTGQGEFRADMDAAFSQGLSSAEVLCSFFAKLCYKSLVEGKNSNVKKVRSIENNLKATFDSAHGSVFEHVGFNFVITDCSRILTHELVRHRAGTAFSQTSGRYCRLDSIDLVWDPILDPVKSVFLDQVQYTEVSIYTAECKLGLRKPPPEHPTTPASYCLDEYGLGWSEYGDEVSHKWVPDDSFDFDKRKKITSAIRRVAPNGQANEIGFTCNLRTLRHTVQVRTAPAAEWEIRSVFAQIYKLVNDRHPLMFHGAKVKEVDGLPWVHGMKLQPYERDFKDYSTEELQVELDRRKK